MMKHEFEALVNAINAKLGKPEITVTPEQYEKIEAVYNWHPIIGNTTGKDQIANIFVYGGMVTIGDMKNTADTFRDFEDRQNAVEAEVNAYEAEFTAKIRALQDERETFLRNARERQKEMRADERRIRAEIMK